VFSAEIRGILLAPQARLVSFGIGEARMGEAHFPLNQLILL
jgi:hypothetical protein